MNTVDKKSQTPTVVRLRESTKLALNKKCHREDRSASWVIEKALRRDLGLDKGK